MRKNKFVAPLIKRSQSSCEHNQQNNSPTDCPLIQNKIYFPSNFVDKLLPYKIQISYHKKNKSDYLNGNHLYSITQRTHKKEKQHKTKVFGRQKKFKPAVDYEDFKQHKKISETCFSSNELKKYNTLQLSKLPEIAYTKSGATIYRSKNIKSVRKLLDDNNSHKKRKSQVKRNFSVRIQESFQQNIKKSKSSKQKIIRLNQKATKLYQTYFSSRKNIRTVSVRQLPAFQLQVQQTRYSELPEDLLCKQVIQRQLYSSFDQQQQFF